MSYAIIRNENYKMGQLALIYRHNERKNTNYSNKEINKENSIYNYSLKSVNTSYQKAFKNLKEKYNLKGQIKKVSNVMCELIITSDKDFFKAIGEKETKRYFQVAYSFVSNYQNLGEEFIVSAKVHMDESTPHMHIVYIPVVHKFDKNSKKQIKKIACSEFWKGKDSYRKLQDNFYKCITENGFDLERGNANNNEHYEIEKLKKITNYELQQFEIEATIEKEINSNDLIILRNENKRIIKKINKLANRYVKIKNTVSKIQDRNVELENHIFNLKQENQNLKKENTKLFKYLEKTFEYVSILFDFPKERLQRLVKNFVEKMKGEN